jgi:hypothetical protein
MRIQILPSDPKTQRPGAFPVSFIDHPVGFRAH